MKESPREQFRWAPHTGGLAVVKPKDYEAGEEVEATTPYAVWKILLAHERALSPGDLLEVVAEQNVPGQLLISKYIGFEPAQWYVPEPKPVTSTDSDVISPSQNVV